ncbi:MAG: SRPBCC family protein [Ilumatobacter sp.]
MDAVDSLARETFGVPLFVNRGRDGRARVFCNSCRHRGAAVVDGQGCAQTLVCQFHGWSYRLDGSIAHIPHADGFPADIASERALVEVASVEANGLIVAAGPDGIDAPDSTGIDAPELLLADTLADHRLVNVTREEQPINWKVLVEQTLEGYHIRSAHRSTFYPVQYDNLNVIEFSGRHSRVTYPYRNIERQATRAPEARRLRGCSTTVTHLFPNTIVSTFPELTLVSIIDPLAIDRSRITTFLLTVAESNADGTEPISSGTALAAEGAVEDTKMSSNEQNLHSNLAVGS